MLDLLIIGGGPTGISAGIAARKAGLNFLIVEKGVLVNSIFHFPTNMTFFSTSKLLEIGDVPFISHTDKPSRREALEYYRRLVETWKLPVKTYEEVLELNPQEGNFYDVKTSKATYQAKHVVICTGFYDVPRMLNVSGEGLPKVKHYYDEAHPYIGKKILVVGAANSGCDVALELWQKGAEVTMAVRKPTIYEKVKYWIKPNIENRIKEGSIKAHFNTTVQEIKLNSVVLKTPDRVIEIENDFVFAMTGYQPNFKLLKQLGIEISNTAEKIPTHHSETLETNLPGVYLAGVVCAGMLTSKLFIENTREHGDVTVSYTHLTLPTICSV